MTNNITTLTNILLDEFDEELNTSIIPTDTLAHILSSFILDNTKCTVILFDTKDIATDTMRVFNEMLKCVPLFEDKVKSTTLESIELISNARLLARSIIGAEQALRGHSICKVISLLSEDNTRSCKLMTEFTSNMGSCLINELYLT